MGVDNGNEIRKRLERIFGFTISSFDSGLDTFYFDTGGNKFNATKFMCRFYPKYFDVLLDEICDLSKKTVFRMSEESTWLLRKRLKVFDGEDVSLTDYDIANQLGKIENSIKTLYYKVCDELRMNFIDYSFENFIIDIQTNNITLDDINFCELFPYDDSLIECLLNSYKTQNLGELCKYGSLSDVLFGCLGDNVVLVDAKVKSIIHRLRFLGVGSSYSDGLNFTNRDFLLEKPISSLGLSLRTLNKLYFQRIYTIGMLCVLNYDYFINFKGIGAVAASEIVTKIHGVGLTFSNEKAEEVVGDVAKLVYELKKLDDRERELVLKLSMIQNERSLIYSKLSEIEGRSDSHPRSRIKEKL